MRIDIWDVQAAKDVADIYCGYPMNFSEKYSIDYEIGKGGFGTVRAVTDVLTGMQYACKTVRKKLEVPNVSVAQQAKHIDNLKREISIMRKLRGTLSVVHFKGAYEDATSVHIVMEYCRGGELHHRIGKAAYSEKTVQRIMKCCLQCLAQCHSHLILHRDIKPGNFMWLTDEEDSPVKALDFGLAVFFKTDELPRTDLGLEGTPWFMAPEVLSSQTYPASDVWSAGVMAYQLLSGYLPFDDRRNPNNPGLSVIWKGILTEQPKMSGKAWADVSDAAKDFVQKLLVKDPAERPSAKAALQHPWLFCEESALPSVPLSHTVVQRIQRYCQSNLVKRSILELIAQELMDLLRAADQSVHGGRSQRGCNSAAAAALLQRRFPGKAGSSPSEPSAEGPLAEEGHSVPVRFGSFVSPFHPVGKGGIDAAASTSQGGEQAGNGYLRSGSDNGSQAASQEGSLKGHGDSRRTTLSACASGKQLEALGEDEFREEIGRRLQRRVNSVHGGTEFLRMQQEEASTSGAGGPEGSLRGSRSLGANVAALGKAHTTHGASHYWRMMRAAATLMNSGKRPLTNYSSLAVAPGGAVGGDYLRYVGRTDAEREEQAKARRLALDVSAHGSESYSRLVRQLSSGIALDQQLAGIVGVHPSALEPLAEHVPQSPAHVSLDSSSQTGPRGQSPTRADRTVPFAARLPKSPEDPVQSQELPQEGDMEWGRRGQGGFKALMAAQGVMLGNAEAGPQGQDPAGTTAKDGGTVTPPVPSASCLKEQGGNDLGKQRKDGSGSGRSAGHKNVSWGLSPDASAGATAGHSTQVSGPTSTSNSDRALAKTLSEQLKQMSAEEGRVADPRQLADVLNELSFAAGNSSITRDELGRGLSKLGFILEDSELQALVDQLDLNRDGVIGKTEFLASQMDWNVLQEDCRDLWLQCAKRAFAALDTDNTGKLSSEQLVKMLRRKLPSHEVDWALEDMMIEAGYADADEMDFEGFLRMAKAASHDSLDNLDQYEARMDPGQFHPALEPLDEDA